MASKWKLLNDIFQNKDFSDTFIFLLYTSLFQATVIYTLTWKLNQLIGKLV